MKKIRMIGVLTAICMMLLSVVSYATSPEKEVLRWTGLSSCDNSLEVAYVGAFKTTLRIYGSTTVHYGYYAGVIVYLETLDEDDDWVTVTAWSDYDQGCAAVSTTYKVSAGTYRLSCTHRSYTSSNYGIPLETHYTTSSIVVTH